VKKQEVPDKRRHRRAIGGGGGKFRRRALESMACGEGVLGASKWKVTTGKKKTIDRLVSPGGPLKKGVRDGRVSRFKPWRTTRGKETGGHLLISEKRVSVTVFRVGGKSLSSRKKGWGSVGLQCS